jgi:hypothetical protein
VDGEPDFAVGTGAELTLHLVAGDFRAREDLAPILGTRALGVILNDGLIESVAAGIFLHYARDSMIISESEP